MVTEQPAANEQVEAVPLLKIEHVTKRFPRVLANDDVSFEIRQGEVHCLLGENGAGKTTLAEILYGAYRPDGGSLYFKDKPITFASPRDALALGIGMVHQHFVLVPTMSVIENIVIGTQSAGLWLDLRQPIRQTESLCASYGIELDLRARVSDLSVGQQQWVEILKALYRGVKLLILDEPTAVLTPQETAKLFAILQKMREQGLTIVFITHKLHEVMAISGRVTVLRKGKWITTVDTAAVTPEELARLMVGREIAFWLEREKVEVGPPLLEVQDLRALNDRGREALRGVSFQLHRGEVLGVAGVSGYGQRELLDVLVGVRRATEGRVLLAGRDITNRSSQYIAGQGLACVPEDRIRQGLMMDFRVDENLILGLQRNSLFARWLFLKQPAIEDFAKALIAEYEIATPSARQLTKVLSGGNLQKVIMARELSQKPKCLIASQPTRGLDVGATEYVRTRLLEQRRHGAGILLISEDLDEVLNLSTRVAVIFKGRLVAILDAAQANRETVGLWMAGGHAGPP